MIFDHFCAAQNHSKLILQGNNWIFMQFHKGEIQCLHSTLITLMIQHTKSDPLFKDRVFLPRRNSSALPAPSPQQHPLASTLRKTGIHHRYIAACMDILNEVGQKICVLVFSEVKTASTSNVYFLIISRNVG